MRFKRIYVEILNICNLNCKFCSKQMLPKKEITIDEFIHIVDKIKGFTKYIHLHIKGEPLLHRDLSSIIDICTKEDISINITTNGTLIGNNIPILTKKNAVRQLNISLHALNNNNAIDKEKYFLDIDKLLASEDKPIIQFRLWTYNNDNILNNDYIKILNYLNKISNIDVDIFKKGENIKLLDNVYLSFDKEFKWPNLNDELVSDSGFCQGLRNMVGILANGDVVPCCLDCDGIIVLGNIYENSFDAIINSDRAFNFLENIKNRKLTEDLCKRCTYIKRFDK